MYQVNCTFFDALGGDDATYLAARTIQLFAPGIPQVYYVGLLAGANDLELLERTGIGRDVNRHHYTQTEITADLERPVVRQQLELLALRSRHPAFQGRCEIESSADRVAFRWVSGDEWAEAVVDVATVTAVVKWTDADLGVQTRTYAHER